MVSLPGHIRELLKIGSSTKARIFPLLFLLQEYFAVYKIKCQSKSRQNQRLLLKTVTEESKLTNRHSLVPLDRTLPTRPGRQAIRSDCLITISIPYHVAKGGGCHRKRGGGGFSGSNYKPDTDSQTYPTIPCTGQGFKNKISDWMRLINLRKSISGDTIPSYSTL